MTVSEDPIPTEAVLGELPWLRRLALQLVRDPHHAEDLAQDTFRVAIEKPPTRVRNLRAWLARVLKNLHVEERRKGARHERHLNRLPDRNPDPSAAEVAGELEVHRRVLEAFEDLDEPFRTVLHMRYFGDVPPRTIAKQRGVPVATVNSQLARGIAKLRHALRERHGGERLGWCMPWLIELEPANRTVAASSAGGISAGAGVLIMKKSVWSAVAVVVVGLVCGYTLWPESSNPGPNPAEGPGAVSAEAATMPSDHSVAATSAGTDRVDVATPGASDDAGPVDIATFLGLVLDPTGKPVADVRVGATGEPATRSSIDGMFELAVPDRRTTIRSSDRSWATVLEARVGHGVGSRVSPPIVVVAAAVVVSGRVVDERGEPIAHANVSLRVPSDMRVRIAQPLDASHEVAHDAETDGDGRFEFETLPAIAGADLLAQVDGFPSVDHDAPTADTDDIEIVMVRPRSAVGTLLGQVVDHVGYPVAGARVVLGRVDVTSLADGTFTLPLDRSFERRDVWALCRGHRPGKAELAPWTSAPTAASPPFVTLQLGPPTGEIAGVVVDSDGRPVENARVWVEGATAIGTLDDRIATLEGYLGSGRTPTERQALDASELDADGPTTQWGFVRTNATGRFRVGGLLRDSYRLGVLTDDALASTVAGPFPLGTQDARLELPRDAVLSRVTGVVVGSDGEPIEGVEVRVRIWPYEVTYEDARADFVTSTPVAGPHTRTDADGRFTFHRVGATAELRVEGDGIVPLTIGSFRNRLADALDGDPERARIVVARRHHLRVELQDEHAADRFRVVDDGAFTAIHRFSGPIIGTTSHGQIEDGRSEVVAVAETVDTVVLLRDEVEVARVSVTLRAGEVTTVRW